MMSITTKGAKTKITAAIDQPKFRRSTSTARMEDAIKVPVTAKP